jgi:proline iminopeptidase
LEVECTGTGPVAVVLHGGLGIDHRPYRSLDPLADVLRLVYLDHRGNGGSEGAGDLTMEQWADDAAAIAGLESGGEPFVVIGHSFGGFIAQELAIRHPDAIRALVLVGTTPGQLGEGEEPAPPGPPPPPEFLELLQTMPSTDDQLAEGMMKLAAAYVHRASPDVLRSLMDGTVFRADVMRKGFEELAGWSAVDRLYDVKAPTLLLVGRHDSFTSWPQSERIAGRLRDAEVVVLEDSGHFPWLDEPEEFFMALRAWLRRRSITP